MLIVQSNSMASSWLTEMVWQFQLACVKFYVDLIPKNMSSNEVKILGNKATRTGHIKSREPDSRLAQKRHPPRRDTLGSIKAPSKKKNIMSIHMHAIAILFLAHN